MAHPARTDRTAILAVTLSLADEAGLDAVSLRAVARRVGVTPMALYRHIGDKAQLLDGLVETLLLEQPLPEPDLPWRERLRALAAGLRATARRHPTLFPLLLQRPATTPAARRVRDLARTAVREGGVEEVDVARVERLLATFALGFAASEAAGRFTATPEELDADFAWALPRILDALVGTGGAPTLHANG